MPLPCLLAEAGARPERERDGVVLVEHLVDRLGEKERGIGRVVADRRRDRDDADAEPRARQGLVAARRRRCAAPPRGGERRRRPDSARGAAGGGVSARWSGRGAAVTSEARGAARGRLDGRVAARTLGALRRGTTALGIEVARRSARAR